MLILTLRKIERDGFIERTVFAVITPRVEFEPSPLGRPMTTPVTALADWAVTHHDAITSSRARYDADRPAHP
jgi:DNA-binding HxlR family transcriptional regulator